MAVFPKWFHLFACTLTYLNGCPCFNIHATCFRVKQKQAIVVAYVQVVGDIYFNLRFIIHENVLSI